MGFFEGVSISGEEGFAAKILLKISSTKAY
jgi:hypothetical protein